MSTEAMKLALEALEMWCPMTATYLNTRDKAITALQEALAQPQPEPVAWMNAKRDMTYLYGPYNADDIPLYTSPPAQSLPFGVGGGLVAIKTLLSRDPCAHANTTIQMIDSMLAKAALHKGDA